MFIDLRSPLDRYLSLVEGEGGAGGGTGGGAPPPEPNPTPTPSGEPEGGGEKLLPQSQVNTIVSSKIGETKAATTKDITDALGCTVDEAKAILEKHRQDQDALLTEAQRQQKEAETASATATKLASEAALDRRDAKVERSLIKAAGLDPDDEKGSSKLARLLGMVTHGLPVDADSVAITAAIDAVKEDFPELFVAGSGTPPPPHSDRGGAPRGGPNGKGDAKSAEQKGRERAKAHSAVREFTFLDTAKS